MKTTFPPWTEAGFDPAERPAVPRATQVFALRILFWTLLTPLSTAFALEPSFKIGSAIAGVLLIAAWIRRDLQRGDES